MKFRTLNDYRVIYKPSHPSAMKSENWEGYVYEHIYIMELHLGRTLNNDEVVHHMDGNKKHNALDNLLLLNRVSHGKLHAWIDKGCPYDTPYEERYCEECGIFLYTKDSTMYCSNECRGKAAAYVKDKPDPEILLEMVKNSSYLQVGKKFNVSDNAVRKWIKKAGYDPKTFLPLKNPDD